MDSRYGCYAILDWLSRWIGLGRCTWRAESAHREGDIVTAILVTADANAPRDHILENHVHLGGAQRVVEGVMLRQHRQMKVALDAAKREVDSSPGGCVAVLPVVVEL